MPKTPETMPKNIGEFGDLRHRFAVLRPGAI